MSQFLTRRSGQLTGLLAVGAIALVSLAACAACGGRAVAPAPGRGGAVRAERGGELSVSARTEPRTFNRLTSREATTDLVASLMQAKLVHINRVTDEVEPWLAESWTRDAAGLAYTLKLRPNVAFSDGHPMTAGDVVFSLEAAYAVPLAADALQPGGKKLTMAAADPLTVVLTSRPLRAGPAHPRQPVGAAEAQARGGAQKRGRSTPRGACPRRRRTWPASARSC